MIGDTPLIKIQYRIQGKINEIYTKLEYYNLTGSIKDRVAYYILEKAKEKGQLKNGMCIVEATSGNTGISLAALAAYYHYPCYIFMPNWVSEERKKIMTLYGAHVIQYSKEEGGFQRCILEAKKFAEENHGFLANQFSNEDNILAHYETTGEEISKQLDCISGFVSGIGTGGTLMGTAKRLKEINPDLIVAALEPDTMALLSNGVVSEHKIEGIGDDFIPEIVNQNQIDTVLTIHDEDAIAMSRKLAQELGLGVGISSGCNLIGAILLKENIEGNVVTVFPDSCKKYLSTALVEGKLKQTPISDAVELLSYEWIC